MKPRKLGLRILIQLALVAGSVAFLFPLFWLLSTSLKPVEQTMQLPHEWLPRMYYAVLDVEEKLQREDGVTTTVVVRKRVKVVKKHENEIRTTSTIVRIEEGPWKGKKKLVPATLFRDGRAVVEERTADLITTASRRAAFIKHVPAGWYYVLQKFERQAPDLEPGWDCLPEEEIEEHVEPQWFNYRVVLNAAFAEERNYTPFFFFRYLGNTLTICFLGVLGVVISSAIVAYGLARIAWKGRNILFVLTLATMMVPLPVTMVPLYALYRKIGTTFGWPWIGTFKPLWVPFWFGSAFNIFLLRQFFKTIPAELSDAARIDGCSEWRIFWNVILPLSKPALAVVALFHFMYSWNDFLGPLIYLTENRDFTLSLALQFFQQQQGGAEWHFLMATATLMVVPVIVLFFFTQKTFIQGIATTGTKG